MAGNIVKIILTSAQVLGRAFTRAVRNEYQASQAAASRAGNNKKATQQAAQNSLFGMTLDEAKQILNVDNITDEQKLTETYEHLMKVNDKKAGGTFYLQSKVYRAKERIDMELDKSSEKKNEV